jgi:hypothetical protein
MIQVTHESLREGTVTRGQAPGMTEEKRGRLEGRAGKLDSTRDRRLEKTFMGGFNFIYYRLNVRACTHVYCGHSSRWRGENTNYLIQWE